MKERRRVSRRLRSLHRVEVALSAVSALLVAGCLSRAEPAPVASAADADLARARNLGVAEYQNEEYGRAMAQFQRAVALAPDSAADRINVAISALKASDHETATAALLATREIDPSYLHVPYLLGIVYLRTGDYEKARAELEVLVAKDPLCAPANYNLGVTLKRLKRDEEARKRWLETIRLEPNHAAAHFQLFNMYNARRELERAKGEFDEYMRIKKSNLGPGTTPAAVEESRYFELLIETAAPTTEKPRAARVALRDATKEWGLAGIRGAASAVLADLDDDGDADLLLGRSLYRNDSGRFAHVTGESGLEGKGEVSCADAGDFDSDGKMDLALGGIGALSLLRGRGDGTFGDVTVAAGLKGSVSAGACAMVRFVDVDHEGDLDLLVGSADDADGVRLLRNNGNSTFLDVTETARMGQPTGLVSALVLADFDGKNDVDVFLASPKQAHRMFMNLRDGTFRENAVAAGLREAAPATGAAAGDVNGDGFADIVIFGGSGRPAEVWLNNGGKGFVKDMASPVLARVTGMLGPNTGTLVDLDNDGYLDLATGAEDGAFAIFRNDGSGGWTDATDAMEARGAGVPGLVAMRAADLDGDRDQDVVLLGKDGGVRVLANDGGNSNRSIRVRLRGRKNNPDGYGSKIWVRQGSFFLQRESFARWIEIGVGDRKRVDVVGVRWPTGVTQNEIDVEVGKDPLVEISERPGLAESCPFVYAYDGEAFRFVTDILDTTPLGVSLAPGEPFAPNHREAIAIPGSSLKEKDGLLSLRITQELEEITYLDMLRLYAVDHQAGLEVLPDDRFSHAPFHPFRIHAVVPRPPHRAENDEGQDILDALLRADRIYARDCPPLVPKYPGVTTSHALVLDPGSIPPGLPVWLFLRGTTLWTDASVNVAVAQNPDVPIEPVALDVVDGSGHWKRVVQDLGLPAGIDKFLPIDLTGLLNKSDPRVRISTNLALLWDRAFFAVEEPAEEVSSTAVTQLAPLFADLHYRGFSAMESPDGKLPDLYRYDQLTSIPPFETTQAGRYTRYGEVSELLSAADDMYVILAPGDELRVEFPAIALPRLPAGWERDYILDADGWIKDNDLRTLHAETIEPLPFHAMSAYPYPPSEQYPASAAHRRYLEVYQTREVAAPLRMALVR